METESNWVLEMESDIKSINSKIERKRKQVDEGIEQLKALYMERERLIDTHLEVEDE